MNQKTNLGKFITILLCIICVIAVLLIKQVQKNSAEEKKNLENYINYEEQLKNADDTLYEENATDFSDK